MATFTYTPWVTGEVITADKLNSHNCKLILTQEDVENDFKITIPTGLSTEDFFGMMVKSDNNITEVLNVLVYDNEWLVLDDHYYYNPTTGILQSTQPDEDEQ